MRNSCLQIMHFFNDFNRTAGAGKCVTPLVNFSVVFNGMVSSKQRLQAFFGNFAPGFVAENTLNAV